MRPITETRDVQNRVIEYLQAIGWEYIPPADLQEKRGYDIKEPFILEIRKKENGHRFIYKWHSNLRFSAKESHCLRS